MQDPRLPLSMLLRTDPRMGKITAAAAKAIPAASDPITRVSASPEFRARLMRNDFGGSKIKGLLGRHGRMLGAFGAGLGLAGVAAWMMGD